MIKKYDIPMIAADGSEKNYTIEIVGLFMYRNCRSAFESARSFITDFNELTHDFNECYGAYRVTVSYIGGSIKFADNSGMMRFYINREKKAFYHSLARAEGMKNRVPNYPAIAQFLCYGCIYGNETIVKSVILSDPKVYYELKGGIWEKHSKKLKEISDYNSDNVSLNRLVSQAAAHCDGKIGCTITGGIDSRAVLANLINNGIRPQLAITGHNSQADVIIAKQVSETTGLPLTVVSDEIEDEDWLKKSMIAADGQNGICGIYRLDKLARYLHKEGIELQFGGVNGEMYKNSFINQDFPLYIGKPQWERFYKYKVGTFDFPRTMFGPSIRTDVEKLPSVVIPWLKSHEGADKATSYLDAGYEIMQFRCNLVVNMFGNHTTIYNPLMERKMVSFSYSKNPYSLEMQAYQRQEVTEHCGVIKDIKTDRNLTCNYKKRNKEFFNSYLYLIRVGLQRQLLRKKVDIRIDKCFEKGHKDKLFYMALANTKKLGILNKDVKIKDVPTGLADRLFTVGMFFDVPQEKG